MLYRASTVPTVDGHGRVFSIVTPQNIGITENPTENHGNSIVLP